MKPRIKTHVLNGFIRQAVSHNKYKEEQEMWTKRQGSKRQSHSTFDYGKVPAQSKHWSDHDDRRVNDKSESNSGEEKQKDKQKGEDKEDIDDESKEKKEEKSEEIDDLKVMLALYQDAKNFAKASEPKWGHDGFFQLYKDEPEKDGKKWDHGGYLQLRNGAKNPNVSVARFEVRRFRDRDSSSDDSATKAKRKRKSNKDDSDSSVSSTPSDLSDESSSDERGKRKKAHDKKKKKKKKKSSHSKHKKKRS